jgi:hypothetical protein
MNYIYIGVLILLVLIVIVLLKTKQKKETFCTCGGLQSQQYCPSPELLQYLYQKGILTEFSDLKKKGWHLVMPEDIFARDQKLKNHKLKDPFEKINFL